MRLSLSAAAVLALCAALPARAERLDHRGSLGLLLGGGGELKSGVAAGGLASDTGAKLLMDLGGTWAVDYDGNELMALARAGLFASRTELGFIAGYRGYFGKERLKTFFDLGAALQWVPGLMFTAGPRIGAGLQVELTSVVGLYVGAAGQAGFGGGLRFSGELCAGLQLRSYLLE